MHAGGEGGHPPADRDLQEALEAAPSGRLLPPYRPLPGRALHRLGAGFPRPAGGAGVRGSRKHPGRAALPAAEAEGPGPRSALSGERRGLLGRRRADARRISAAPAYRGLPGGSAVYRGG